MQRRADIRLLDGGPPDQGPGDLQRPHRGASHRLPAAAGAILVTLLFGCGAPRLPSLPEPGAPATPVAGRSAEPERMESDGTHGCFQRHLKEAISLNERRSEVYAAWTEGESAPISNRLIRSERLALLVAWYVDRRAAPFQEAGIPIACAEFVSMSLTPPVGDGPGLEPPQPYRPGPDPHSLIATLQDAYAEGGFAAVAAASNRLLKGLEHAPDYHCMTRHLLESTRRIAQLAPHHAAAAERAGLQSTVSLSELLLRLHLTALPDGARLDAHAAPLQQNGVPILCRDVPPIPGVENGPAAFSAAGPFTG